MSAQRGILVLHFFAQHLKLWAHSQISPHLSTDEQGASRMIWKYSQFAVRVTKMPDDLGKLLDMGFEE